MSVSRARYRWAFVLATALAGNANIGCTNGKPPPHVPDGKEHSLAPIAVDDATFSIAVHRLLREGARTPQRSALLAGTVRRQMAHAAGHFHNSDEKRGTDATLGALYLMRIGEARPDMLGPESSKALDGAIRKFSARGDEGRALALMLMQATLLKKGSSERVELDKHIAALEKWMRDTRTGGDIVKLAGDERAAVARALVEPNKKSLDAAAVAIDKWVERAVEYNIAYQTTHQLPSRAEANEAFRALRTGGATMTALFLRHGRARDALERIESSSAERVIPMDLFARLRAAAVDDTAADWRLLARHLDRATFDPSMEELMLEPFLLDAAVWGAAVEAYRRDPTSMAVAHILSRRLIALGMPEAAPLVLRDGLGADPRALDVSSAVAVIIDALHDQHDSGSPDTARRIYRASKAVLDVASQKKFSRVRPRPAELQRVMAGIELRSGNVDAARPLLLESLRSAPSVWGYTMLGMLERQAGHQKTALQYANLAAELPNGQVFKLDVADARLLAFEILRDQGATAEAEKALEQALSIALASRKGHSAPAAMARAEQLLARVLDGYGDSNNGDRAYERALELADGNRAVLGPTVLSALGRALVNKNVESARTALQLGIKADLDTENLVYGAVWLSFLEREGSESPDGKVDRILDEAVNSPTWGGKLARWSRGMLDNDGLRKAATDYTERTEAEFCIAMRGRIDGKAEADQKLRVVAANPLVDLMVVQLARDILAPRLRTKVPSKFSLP